jgi:HEAT repeat protein
MSDDNRIAELEHLLFNEQDWRKRQKAVCELSQINSRKAWDLIGRALLDKNVHVAETAADLLANYGGDALPHLVTGLSEANEHALPMGFVE